MKLIICLMLLITGPFALAIESETSAPDICKVQCDCWGMFGDTYDVRPAFLIGTVESWGYCPVNVDVQKLYEFHVRKNRTQCNQLGDSSASRYLASCRKNF
ncbi:MAG: hypothetical protein KUL82_10170 [Bdellovibrio sp.]|nr:hypothetical protein [Bdellovibrio sp.]